MYFLTIYYLASDQIDFGLGEGVEGGGGGGGGGGREGRGLVNASICRTKSMLYVYPGNAADIVPFCHPLSSISSSGPVIQSTFEPMSS